MKIFKRLVIILLFLAAIAYYGSAYKLSRSIVHPDVLTLEEEKKWLQDRDLLGDFDAYEKEDYLVKGYEDYRIHAQFLKSPDSHSNKYVIISHGFRSNRNGAIKYVDVYRSMGYHIIIYDVRGHGLNEKTPVSLGRLEAEDLYLLIQDSYERFGQDIVLGLHGESMGSAISLSVLAKNPPVAFVVADCSFSNLYDLIKETYKENNIGFLIYGVNTVTSLLYGINMKDSSPMDALEDNEVPILFIHGEKDSFIKPHHSQILAVHNPSRDQVIMVPKAVHAGSRITLGVEAYRQLIEDFLSQNHPCKRVACTPAISR